MPDRGEVGWRGQAGPRVACGEGFFSASLASAARTLENESDRWFLWLPVFFAGGIINYFALADEPAARVSVALLMGAIGLCLFAKQARLGICLGGAALTFASGFAAAKLRTETVRAPVLAHELRYVAVGGFVEAHELRDKGRARIALRVLTLDGLIPHERPYRVRGQPAGERGRKCQDRRGRHASRNAPAAARADRAGRLRLRAPSLVRSPRRDRLRHQQSRFAERATCPSLGLEGVGSHRWA